MNPRMKNAEKLIADGKVEILNNSKERTEARVEGTGVHHTVIIEDEKERCTCEWFSKYQGKRAVQTYAGRKETGQSLTK